MRTIDKSISGKHTVLTAYESISEFVADIKSRPNNKHMSGENSSQTASHSFSGTSSYKEAEELLANGWESGAKKINQMLLDRKVQEDFKQSKMVYSVMGQQAIVPLHLMGVPTSMTYRKPVVTKHKIVTITKDITFNAGTSSEEIIKHGLKAIQLIQALEAQGYRVKLNVMFASSGRSESLLASITLKQPNERLNISKLAFCLGHTSMLRRFLFKWLEVTPTMTTTDFRGGYGRADGELYKQAFKSDNEYYIPPMSDSLESLVKTITKK